MAKKKKKTATGKRLDPTRNLHNLDATDVNHAGAAFLVAARQFISIAVKNACSPLLKAVVTRSQDTVTTLATEDADTPIEGITALICAVLFDHEIVETLLRSRASTKHINHVIELGTCGSHSALSIAIMKSVADGDPRTVQSLLTHGADPMHLVSTGPMSAASTLQLAVNHPDPLVMEALLQRIPHGDEILNQGMLLWDAAMEGNVRLVHALLNAGANADLQNNNCYLLHAVMFFYATRKALELREPLMQIIKALMPVANLNVLSISPWEDEKEKEDQKCSTLHAAVFTGSIELVAEVASRISDIDPRDVVGCTPLHLAVTHELIGISEYLLDCGAAITTKTNDGTTLLMSAIVTGKIDMVMLLTQQIGIPVHDYNDKDEDALSCAMHTDVDPDIIDRLQECGVDLDRLTKKGRLAITEAASTGNLVAVDRLLALGVNPDAPCKAGKLENVTALHFAAFYAHSDVVVRLLHVQRIDRRARDANNHTPAWYAATGEHADTLQVFLRHNPTLANDLDINGDSMLLLALKKRQLEVARALQDTDIFNCANTSGVSPLMLVMANIHLEKDERLKQEWRRMRNHWINKGVSLRIRDASLFRQLGMMHFVA